MLRRPLALPAFLGALTACGRTEPPARGDAERKAEPPPVVAAAVVSQPEPRCPPGMVDVEGRFCVDRFEMSLVEHFGKRRVSAHYHPTPSLAKRDRRTWEYRHRRVGPYTSRQMPLPELPAWQRESDYDVRAESRRGVVPNAYLDLASARRACAHAGKRLCGRDEWLTACRGEGRARHPYGETFVDGRCNVSGPLHPAPVLHGSGGLGPRDPRMNLVMHEGKPLLRKTGEMTECASRWGDDAAFDMVGNLDEWIDDPGGVFVGGFYARETQWGCDARIAVHRPDYYDYSIGARCCQ